MPPWAPKQLYYPRWMFGEWQARKGAGVHITLGLPQPVCPDVQPDVRW